MRLKLAEMAAAIGATYQGPPVPFQGFSIDTRTLKPGACFIALKAARDGHAFISEAIEKGAGAIVCSTPEITTGSTPLIRVKDTEKALGQLAAVWRAQWTLPVIAVTGSSGKTTTRHLIEGILRQRYLHLLAATGNLNNQLGVPLMLGALKPEHEVLVLEMGARFPGDIAYVADLAAPTIGVVTLVNPCHLACFGTVEAIAQTKGELYQALKPGAVAVINQDDVFFPVWQKMAAQVVQVTFSLEKPSQGSSDFYAEAIQLQQEFSDFRLITPEGLIGIHLPLPGRHNIQNAICAAAVAAQAGATQEQIQAGLATATSATRRLELKKFGSSLQERCLIDDSYNASPTTMKVALDLVGTYAQTACFLGDMGELALGQEKTLHAQIGHYAKQQGVLRLYGVGPYMQAACEAFGEGAQWFPSQAALLEALPDILDQGLNAYLVKGSRSAKMDVVADRIMQLLRG